MENKLTPELVVPTPVRRPTCYLLVPASPIVSLALAKTAIVDVGRRAKINKFLGKKLEVQNEKRKARASSFEECSSRKTTDCTDTEVSISDI